MGSNKVFHILVVDDDDVIRTVVSNYLTKYWFVVDTLPQGEHIPDVVNQKNVDLIILDINLKPGRSGYYWLSWLKANMPDIPVLILSSNSEAQDRIRGLEAGARDYLVKPFTPKELLLRIQLILQECDDTQAHQKVGIGVYEFDLEKQALSVKDGESIELTPTETSMLSIMCIQPDTLVTRDQFAQQVFNQEHDPMDRKIDVHINRLRQKVEAFPKKPKYIQTVWGKGYKFVSTNEPS